MSDFFRRIAPAVLVGTAAVAVVASAGTDTPTATAASGGTTALPNGDTPSGGGSTDDEFPDWRDFDFDDDDDEGEDHDDDDDGGGRAQGGGTAVAPPPGSSSSTTGSGATSGGGATTGSTSAACEGAEIVGPTVSTEWGPVQVAARVVNGRVCSVRTIQTPDGDRKSVMINARAVPSLEAQVIAAGSADIDGVSGATVTTVGYKKSLQAILDSAR